MVKCPKCGEEIEHLNEYQSGEAKYWFRLTGLKDWNCEYEYDEFQPDDVTNDYECPECGVVVAKTEKDAIKILRGGEQT